MSYLRSVKTVLMEVNILLKIVVSKKYIVLLQLFVLAKDVPSSTSAENTEMHNDKLKASYIVIII